MAKPKRKACYKGLKLKKKNKQKIKNSKTKPNQSKPVMSEEVDGHVLRRFELCQKLGKGA